MFDPVYFFAFVIVLLIILLSFNFYIKWKAYGQKEMEEKKALLARKKAAQKGLIVTCPLCNSALMPGEDLVSKVYRPMNVPDQLCTIEGCPHCYPVMQVGIKRECPVCGKNVPINDGHLIARLFNYTDGKKHVIVTGCTECCKHSPKP